GQYDISDIATDAESDEETSDKTVTDANEPGIEEQLIEDEPKNVSGGSGTITDPWTISINELVSGAVGSTTDFYYEFEVSQKGCLDLYAAVKGCTGTTWNQATIYQGEIVEGNEIIKDEFFQTDTLEKFYRRGIVPGKYYLYLSMRQATEYQFKIVFTPSDRYEEEIDSAVRPKQINTDGQFYYGLCGWFNYTDTDYYSFSVPKKSTVTIKGIGIEAKELLGCSLYSDAALSNKIDHAWKVDEFQMKHTLNPGTYYITYYSEAATIGFGYKFCVSASGSSNPESKNTFKGVTVKNGGGLSGLDSAINLITKDEGKSYTTEMVKGQKYTLGAGTWESSNKNVATVAAKTGAMTAKAPGNATLTEKQSGTTVTVTVYAPAVSGAKKLSLVAGDEAKDVSLGGLDESSMPVAWVTSNCEVASVSGEGSIAQVTPLGKGNAKITAWVGGKSYVFSVNVKDTYSIGKLSGDDNISLSTFQKATLTYMGGFKVNKATWTDESGETLGADSPVTINKKTLLAKSPVDSLTLIGNDGATSVRLTVTIKSIPTKSVMYINKGSAKTLKHSLVKGTGISWTKDSDNISLANESAATVKVTGAKAGVAELTCTKDGVNFVTEVHVEDPTPEQNSVSIPAGGTHQISFTQIDEPVTYSSKNKAVAFVDENGKIYARKAGKTTVTAKIAGNNIKIPITVN
nr:Ig-like domain-containing protein [Butyrivibrio sp.]